MKKYSGFIVAVLLIVGVVIFLSGCSFFEKATEVLYTAAEKAELTAKAITGYGWESGTSSKDIFIKDVSIDINVTKDDFSGSDFYNQINDQSTFFNLQFENEVVTVQDDGGNDVQVTLSGTVYFAYYFDFDQVSGNFRFALFAYSPDLSSKVDDNNPDKLYC